MSEQWPSGAGFNPLPRGSRFIALPDWLLGVPGLSREGAVVYSMLLRLWRFEQRCYPSVEWLARHLHIDRRNVKRQLRTLERLGLIEVHRRIQDGRQQSNAYTFRAHPAFSTGGDSAPGSAVAESSPVAEPPPGAEVAVGGGDSCHFAGPTGDTTAPQLESLKRDQIRDQNSDARASRCSGVDQGLSVETLESRYDASLARDARVACAGRRKRGKASDAAWLRALQQLAALPVDDANYCMRELITRHADDDRLDERYLIGIAKNRAQRRGGNGHSRKGPAPVATAEDFEKHHGDNLA